MDRTKSELRERLLRQDFPEKIADEAVRYVESFGYVDDRRYVESFILSRKGRKSKREIFAELSRKQVDEAIVDEMMERCYDAEGIPGSDPPFPGKRDIMTQSRQPWRKSRKSTHILRGRAFPTGRSKR